MITLSCPDIANAQVVYEPLTNSVYRFLNRMDIKFNYLNEEAKPFTRKEIARYLTYLEKNSEQLNLLEKEELNYYIKEFSDKKGFPENWKLYKYKDNNFNVSLSPLLKYGYKINGSKKGFFRSWGAYVWGTYSDWFGASLNFTDNGEYGENVNSTKFFTPETGHWNNQRLKDGIEYSDVKGSISFSWGWGNVSLIKDYFTFGNGEFGQLIHSTKAPDYPHLRFELHPVKWFSFYYVHGWLTSCVDDSIYFFPTNRHNSNGNPIFRKKYINKYIALNYAKIKPFNWLNIGIGNSVIYDREIRPEFFIPFLLYKFQDHNMGLNNDYGSNGQLFFDIAALLKNKYKFYTSIFVDNASIREVLRGDFARTWTGITFGVHSINLFLPNLDFIAEYTRINPWVYEHYIPTTTYKNIDFDLGHWIGQNADLLQLQINYKILCGLNISLYYKVARKGGLLSKDEQYDDIAEKFLYSPLRTDNIIGLDVRYEYLQNLKIIFNSSYSKISDEDLTRTPEYLLGKKFNFRFTLSYGI